MLRGGGAEDGGANDGMIVLTDNLGSDAVSTVLFDSLLSFWRQFEGNLDMKFLIAASVSA